MPRTVMVPAIQQGAVRPGLCLCEVFTAKEETAAHTREYSGNREWEALLGKLKTNAGYRVIPASQLDRSGRIGLLDKMS